METQAKRVDCGNSPAGRLQGVAAGERNSASLTVTPSCRLTEPTRLTLGTASSVGNGLKLAIWRRRRSSRGRGVNRAFRWWSCGKARTLSPALIAPKARRPNRTTSPRSASGNRGLGHSWTSDNSTKGQGVCASPPLNVKGAIKVPQARDYKGWPRPSAASRSAPASGRALRSFSRASTQITSAGASEFRCAGSRKKPPAPINPDLLPPVFPLLQSQSGGRERAIR